MNANQIITKCNQIKPNGYCYEQKLSWLYDIESDIIENLNKYSDQRQEVSFDESDNPTLILPKCCEMIYLYYLISMIDLANQEYDLYNNSSSFFNYEYDLWKKRFRQTHLPRCNISIKV